MKDLVSITVYDTTLDKEKVFEIPRALLKWHSLYFAAALDPESKFYTGSGLRIIDSIC
jgi:hypothetical protein